MLDELEIGNTTLKVTTQKKVDFQIRSPGSSSKHQFSGANLSACFRGGYFQQLPSHSSLASQVWGLEQERETSSRHGTQMTRRGHKRKNWPVWQRENDAKNGMLMEWNHGPFVEVHWLIFMFVLSFTTVFWCIFGGAPPDCLFYIKKNLRFDFSKKDVKEFWISPSPCAIWEQMLSCSFIGKNSLTKPLHC